MESRISQRNFSIWSQGFNFGYCEAAISMRTTVAPDAKRNYFNVSELIMTLILYSYISNMAAPTLARAERRKQKNYLLFKRADSCAR